MTLRLYSTLSRKKEEFTPIEPGKVRIYVCGPTVYDKAHIGHAMSAIIFDIIRRYLIFRGYQVNFVMNFTDVDDKIILRANKLGMDPFQLGQMYIDEYQAHLRSLNVLPATFNPRATQEMPQILEMIEGLIAKGYAYPAGGDVYFRVQRDEDYGRLSGRHLDDMQAGARVEIGEQKEHPMDFALWKAAKAGEPAWESPWGPGRPGWHIECSAMNLQHLGEQIDIHGGGNDLVFPHHENEIAQTESLTGKPFARYWMHNGMLQLGSEKMSKSLGNLITIEAFLAQHSADAFRMLILNGSYRGPLTYTEEVVIQAERSLERLLSALRPALPGAAGLAAEGQQALAEQVQVTEQAFVDAMDDDFNSAGALAALFELVRAINQARADGGNAADLQAAQTRLRELGGVLGLRLEEPGAKDDEGQSSALVNLLLEVRLELRKQKLWALSDQIRDRLKESGVTIEDSTEGSTWRWS